ncbi:MAG TPA: DUF5995 family protein, partial [Thermoanaerobaculia bacterium]|nr:DUF5995 family protein [Thermoanaerobaculia bacterium]
MAFGDAEIARSIDEVLQALDGIIASARQQQSRLGFFAALYRKVTARVKAGIAQGYFADGPRMERLDVVFANRYLGALARWQEEKRPTEAWQLAFSAAEKWRPILLQHLLLGINAHINLDLGIAAATVAPGAELASLQDDFERINEILFSLVAGVEAVVGRVSPAIAWLDRLGGRIGQELVRFSLEVARDEAWTFAQDLARVGHQQWSSLIELRDHETTVVGQRVLSPGPILSLGLLWIRLRETASVGEILDL